MAEKHFDQTKLADRLVVTLIGMSLAEQVILALLLVKAGSFITAVFYNGGNFYRMIFGILLSELFFSVGILVVGGKKSLLYGIEQLLFSLLLSGAYAALFYARTLIEEYLNKIQLRPEVVAVDVVLRIAMVGMAACLSVGSFSAFLSARNHKFGERGQGRILRTILLLFMAVLFYLPYRLVNTLDSVSVNEPLFQVENGEYIKFEGKSTIKKAGTGCTLENQNGLVTLSSAPLFFENSDQVLLTTNYAIIRPSISSNNKVSNLSRVIVSDGEFYVKTDRGDVNVYDFFLFDGKNSYLFFENCYLYIDDQRISIKPFTYIIAVHNKTLTVFSKQNMSYEVFDVSGKNVNVEMNDGNVVNVGLDTITRVNGKEQMLFIQPNQLEEIQ